MAFLKQFNHEMGSFYNKNISARKSRRTLAIRQIEWYS